MARSQRGVLITLEGPDGSGKSTQMRLLAARLRKAGVPCVVTREPGGGGENSLAEKIRNLVLASHKPAPTAAAELFLFLAARAQHVHDLILPALKKGQPVLCERFSDATYAYQVGGRKLPAEFVLAADRLASAGVRPTLTVLLDLPIQAGLDRAFDHKNRHDRIESEGLAFHQRVRNAYLRTAKKEPGRVRVVSALGSVGSVEKKIWDLVAPVIRRKAKHAVL